MENYDKTAPPYQERVIGYAIEAGICHFLSEYDGDWRVNVLDAVDKQPALLSIVEAGRAV